MRLPKFSESAFNWAIAVSLWESISRLAFSLDAFASALAKAKAEAEAAAKAKAAAAKNAENETQEWKKTY